MRSFRTVELAELLYRFTVDCTAVPNEVASQLYDEKTHTESIGNKWGK